MAFIPSVFYKDPRAALKWLEAAFGFETSLVVENPDGSIGHSEMTFGGATVNVGSEWSDPAQLASVKFVSPLSIGGAGTAAIEVHVESGIDAHCEQARASGALITQEPADQFYGARTYRAVDQDGHEWSFVQPTHQVSRAEAEQAVGAFDKWTNDPAKPPVFRAQRFYRDPKAVTAWLEGAFRFETVMLIENDAGLRAHLAYEGGQIALGNEGASEADLHRARKSPLSLDGANTHAIEVTVETDIDAHCEHARAAGARITQEPADQFYGARTYRALDPEDHVWTFLQPIREVSNAEMEAASGLRIKTSL
jgi:uncharacterized glyoxalase superfamily protein PhnB